MHRWDLNAESIWCGRRRLWSQKDEKLPVGTSETAAHHNRCHFTSILDAPGEERRAGSRYILEQWQGGHKSCFVHRGVFSANCGDGSVKVESCTSDFYPTAKF
jgi:hypothetical protein